MPAMVPAARARSAPLQRQGKQTRPQRASRNAGAIDCVSLNPSLFPWFAMLATSSLRPALLRIRPTCARSHADDDRSNQFHQLRRSTSRQSIHIKFFTSEAHFHLPKRPAKMPANFINQTFSQSAIKFITHRCGFNLDGQHAALERANRRSVAHVRRHQLIPNIYELPKLGARLLRIFRLFSNERTN